MILKNRLPVAAAIAATTIATVVGCSHSTPTSSGTSTTAQPTPTSIQPAATSTAEKAPSSGPQLAADIDATITAEGSTDIKVGGPPMRFAVTLVNNGPDVAQVGLVVSLGHCSCGPGGARMMAKGTMQRLDPQTNTWVEAPYVREGTGMDYITANLVPPFPLNHGQTVSYQLEMKLDAEQYHITNGEGGIEVTLADPVDPMEGQRLGKGAFLPITVET
jgi:hypothetical protein